MSILIVKDAFEKVINNWNENRDPSLKLVWEDINENKSDEVYVECYLFPVRTYSLFLDGSGHTAFEGYFQFNVVVDSLIGTRGGLQIAKEITDLFPCDSFIQESNETVLIPNPPNISGKIKNRNKITIPVIVDYLLNVTA